MDSRLPEGVKCWQNFGRKKKPTMSLHKSVFFERINKERKIYLSP